VPPLRLVPSANNAQNDAAISQVKNIEHGTQNTSKRAYDNNDINLKLENNNQNH